MAQTCFDYSLLASPILLAGDALTAYRDPAVLYHEGVFHLFCTFCVKQKPEDPTCWQVVTTTSRDLLTWSVPQPLTPKDPRLNFSSPGNVIRHDGQWVLCMQTYPTPRGEKHGNCDSRLWIIRSDDLQTWGNPQRLQVRGPQVPVEQMGRMIDPYLLADKDEPGLWWCFYKQNGVSLSRSRDLDAWEYVGRMDGGENVCVLVQDDQYVMIHSPRNGIGIKRSGDLGHWRDEALLTLGQADWPWAAGRLTAGFVLDLRRDERFARYLLFFHGSGPEGERTMFDNNCSIALAWSRDLKVWEWPGRGDAGAH